MKCGIITVYNSENSGSFLQAYAMSRALKAMGHDAVFMRQGFKGHSSTLPVHLKNVAKSILKSDFRGAKLRRIRRAAFRRACKKYFQIVDASEQVDCLVLGSDVIWDLTESYFRDNHAFFWGMAFGETKVISYAPSLGFAKEKELEENAFVRDALSKMTVVSVRDKTSKQLLQPYVAKELQLVCDPTYLIDRQDYDAIAKPTDLNQFIFLYCYGKLSEQDRKAIQVQAKKEGLKTVTFGGANAWCDVNLAYDPLLFLSLYAKAAYIITDTFHGTVFATIYEKNFAVIKNKKPKVLDILEVCGLSDKMMQSEEDLPRILHSDFAYVEVRRRLEQERENGLQYLRSALERCD